MNFELSLQPTDRAFLCGAGISAPEPSGLKLVNKFLTELHAEMDCRTKIERKIIDQVIWGNSTYRPLRFEQVISCLLDIDEALTCLNYLLVRKQKSSFVPSPNSYHYFLAEQWQAGATILTTNFDILIEVARLSLFGEAAKPLGSLIKLHGTIQTIEDGSIKISKSEIKADIRSVAEKNAIASVSDHLDTIAQQLSQKSLYVIGYSFNDSFDVTPLLESSCPRSVHVFDYAQQAPVKVPLKNIHNLRDFPRIAKEWGSIGIKIKLWQGDPSQFFKPISATPPNEVSSMAEKMPEYPPDKLCYVVGRLLVYQDALDEANNVFAKLVKDEPARFGGRAAFYWARTLPDWQNMLEEEKYLRAILPTNSVGWRIYILLLDAAAFLGPAEQFFRICRDFRTHFHTYGAAESEKERTLYLGKGYHAAGNFLLNIGRPRWAEEALRRSIDLRTKSGEPADIFFAEFGLCLALAHQGRAEEIRARLHDLSIYASSISDISSEICIAILSGLTSLLEGDPETADGYLRDAQHLYQLGEDEKQIDPELELYILACEFRTATPRKAIKAHLDSIRSYVHANKYAFYYDVIAAFDAYVLSGLVPKNLSRLSKGYFSMAGLYKFS